MYYMDNTFSITKAEIKAVISHASSDSTRPIINAVAFEASGYVSRITATNGRTIIVCERILERQGAFSPRLLPLCDLIKAARMLRTNKHKIRIIFSDGGARMVVADGDNEECGCVESKLVDAMCPAYDRVIPRFDNENGQGGGGAGIVRLSAKYLASVALIAKAVEDNDDGVHMMVGGRSLDPVVITAGRDTEWTLVIMPVRIEQIPAGFHENSRIAAWKAAAEKVA